MPCPNCEELPRKVQGDLWLYLWPPLGHTRKKLDNWAADRRAPAITDEKSAIAIVLPDDRRSSDIVELAGLLTDRKSTRLNSSHTDISRMPSSA